MQPSAELAPLVDDLPDVGEALHAGRIGTAQADELARVRANPRCGDQLVDSIEILLEHAEQLSFDDARTCLRRWEVLADLDGAHADREASVENRTATAVDLDGSLFLRATGGDALATAEMIAIFDAQLEREFHADVAENSSLACGRHNPTKHIDDRVKRTARGHVIYHRRDGTPTLAVGRRHPDTLPPNDEQLIELARRRARALRTSA